MSYFWILLVVLVALSPLISAMPTRRQRRIADLRQAAAVSGLYVQLRESPLEDKSAPLHPFYGRRRQREHGQLQAPVSYRHSEQGWMALEGEWAPAAVALLEQLPAGASLACEELQGVGIYWDESGEKADVLQINEVLRGLLVQRE
jgi:hypothetical protein